MPAQFLHGSETVNIDSPNGSINIVRSSIIALIGIAPKGNGGAPTVTVTTAETKATASVTFATGVTVGNSIAIYINNVFLLAYTRVSGDTTMTLFAASIVTAINALSSGFTAVSTGAVLTITYKAGFGASANGQILHHTAPDADGTFAGGVDAVATVTPSSTPQQLTLCSSPTDDAQFGSPVPGFNIPKTLDIIRQIAGNVAVVVVNVFDPTVNTKTITDEVVTLVNGKCALADAPIGALISIKNNSGSVIPTVAGIDYTLDDYGNFVSLTSRIGFTTTVKFTYKALDATTITANQIIGGIDSTSNIRTGLALFDLTYTTFGFTPKIFVSPFYSQISAVDTQLALLADKFRAVYLKDAPLGTSLGNVIQGRGNTTINFNTASRRAMLLYPFGKSYDKAAAADALYPYSAFMAGLIAWNDNENGYWTSPSNKAIPILTGTEVPVSFQINDAGCEANQLNAVGVTTIVSSYGSGFKAWGNRSAAFPTDTDPRNFISLQRLDDIITESMELAVASDLDKPITAAFIRTMLAKGNTLIANLIRQGAVQPGSKVVYNKTDNPADQLAKGHIVFTRIYMGAPPAERVTFNNVIDITLLSKLG